MVLSLLEQKKKGPFKIVELFIYLKWVVIHLRMLFVCVCIKQRKAKRGKKRTGLNPLFQ